MKKVNPYFLHVLLGPLTGLGDDDDEVEKYSSLDPEDESAMRSVIRELIVPTARQMSAATLEKVKLAYQYYLSKPGANFERVFNSILPPFEAPKEPRRFFLWMWEECFPGEDYNLRDLQTYLQNPDIDEPLHT